MQDLIGRTLGHYRVVEHLGGGGMGVVYRAEDTKLGREVALKFLPPEWSRDPAARERFLREARAASALEDSRICTVHDIDETDDGRLFIAMAFYEGETLKKRLERGRLPIGTAIDIAIQVAEGLERAHSADIIHRDIKPANLMLTQRDEVVIVDFGLAKLAGELSLTKSGSSLGTPHYMSPEQASGGRVDGRTDLWSLGVVLYEMLTGSRPFDGDNNTAVARAILDDEPQPMANLRPEAPRELGAIVAKALEKDAGKRYQGAGEVLGDLREFQKQLSDREGLTEAAPSRAPTRRRPYLAPVLVAAVIFAVTAGLVWFLRSDGVETPDETSPPRIVVLPFENLGPPEDEYFADGMTEEIISRLAAVSGLRVISRTSAMQYKDTDKGIRQIGEELNVQYALEGTVRWERAEEEFGRVRITPQLIRVDDDSHLWSDRYDRAIESVFEVQSDIARRVVEQLHVSLLKPEEDALDTQLTHVPEAYEAYLRGLHNISLNDFDKTLVAVKMFERAVELDPGFAEAWARLGRLHAWLFGSTFDMSPERRRLAKEAVEKALELDPNMPEGHLALGNYYYRCDRDYDRALVEFAEALAIHPNHVGALSLQTAVFRRQGKWEESTKLLERVFSASPRDPQIAYGLSTNCEFLRDYQRAEKYADLAISLAPDDLDGYTRKFYFLLGQGRIREAREFFVDLPVRFPRLDIYEILLEIADREFEAALEKLRRTPVEVFERTLGRGGAEFRMELECGCLFFLGNRQGFQEVCGQARVALEEKVREHGGNWGFRSALGLVYAYLGRREDAIREGEKAVTLVAEDAIRSQQYAERLGHIYALVGESEAAMDQIEYLLSIPSSLTVSGLRVHPYWDPLRDHPRFQALLEKYDQVR
jgi:serine/threonine protein kinase/Flp pilus assembly protein TadD